MTSDILASLESALYVSVFSWPMLACLVVTERFVRKAKDGRLLLAVAWTLCGGVAYIYTGSYISVLVAALGIITSNFANKRLGNFFESGSFYLVALVISTITAASWGVLFITQLEATIFSRTLILVGFVMTITFAPLTILTALPMNSYLFRKTWIRPRSLLNNEGRENFPMVSLHVPCYAEPPEVVRRTLQSLSELDYPNYEVVVIDNNTESEHLWRPVMELCDRLGPRFRFFHEDSLSGAKAGALNYALRKTHPKAEIIAVIDADYVTKSSFLSSLVGYFDDSKIGFVQTSHDYRNYKSNRFKLACYWEYMPAYRLQIASLNEWSSSYLIGTMCLIRKKALIKAGGWAEWCLTEDSECGLRIHACGYESVYAPHTLGRGLIPENHDEYKKQRLRWTIGPIQQLRKHWRILLFPRNDGSSKLTRMQRLLEFVHGFREASAVLSIPLYLVFLFVAATLVYNEDVVVLPMVIWVALASFIPAGIMMKWLVYRMAGCGSLVNMCWATLASFSLNHTRLAGAIRGIFFSDSLAWHRTSKFQQMPNTSRALSSMAAEAVIGLSLLLTACFALIHANYNPPDLLLLLSLIFTFQGAIYLTSPLMALLAERNLPRDNTYGLTKLSH